MVVPSRLVAAKFNVDKLVVEMVLPVTVDATISELNVKVENMFEAYGVYRTPLIVRDVVEMVLVERLAVDTKFDA